MTTILSGAFLFTLGVFAVLILMGAAKCREIAEREIAARKEEDWGQ